MTVHAQTINQRLKFTSDSWLSRQCHVRSNLKSCACRVPVIQKNRKQISPIQKKCFINLRILVLSLKILTQSSMIDNVRHGNIILNFKCFIFGTNGKLLGELNQLGGVSVLHQKSAGFSLHLHLP